VAAYWYPPKTISETSALHSAVRVKALVREGRRQMKKLKICSLVAIGPAENRRARLSGQPSPHFVNHALVANRLSFEILR
jgi:hypothetical protein